VDSFNDISDDWQVQLTLPSILGFMLFQVSSSREDILPRQALEWLVLFKLDIWLVLFFALDHCPAWLPKPLLDKATFSAY
jgi:hypothetical protein